jgi:hypothetical protein
LHYLGTSSNRKLSIIYVYVILRIYPQFCKFIVKHIIEFPLESGESIFVEVDEAAQIDDRIGLRDQVVDKATQTFESALETVKPIANAIIAKIGSLKQPADEVEVKFGIKISAQIGAVVASGNSEVNYEITLKWKKDSQNGSTP